MVDSFVFAGVVLDVFRNYAEYEHVVAYTACFGSVAVSLLPLLWGGRFWPVPALVALVIGLEILLG